jgi:hypothetical protein
VAARLETACTNPDAGVKRNQSDLTIFSHPWRFDGRGSTDESRRCASVRYLFACGEDSE